MTEVRVDEKGRLTLPAGHKRFLESLDENRLFVTSLDDRRAHVFSQSVWRSRQERREGLPDRQKIRFYGSSAAYPTSPG